MQQRLKNESVLEVKYKIRNSDLAETTVLTECLFGLTFDKSANQKKDFTTSLEPSSPLLLALCRHNDLLGETSRIVSLESRLVGGEPTTVSVKADVVPRSLARGPSLPLSTVLKLEFGTSSGEKLTKNFAGFPLFASLDMKTAKQALSKKFFSDYEAHHFQINETLIDKLTLHLEYGMVTLTPLYTNRTDSLVETTSLHTRVLLGK